MIRQFGFGLLFLTIAGNLGLPFRAEAQQFSDGTGNVTESSTGNVTVTVDELRNQEGNVCLKLFSGSEGFPNDDENALQITCVPIAPSAAASSSTETRTLTESTGSTADASATDGTGEPASASFRYTFENLPYGNYAIAIYHDRNADQRLNRGLFGMPEEGYGFSNDAPANFGPADFEDAVFVLEGTDTAIQIKMRYP